MTVVRTQAVSEFVKTVKNTKKEVGKEVRVVVSFKVFLGTGADSAILSADCPECQAAEGHSDLH